MIRLVGCFNIKTGDKIECEKANFYGDFLFVVEGKYYHTYRIHNKKVSGDLTIVECDDRRFYFKEEPEVVEEEMRPFEEFDPSHYREGTEVMVSGYDEHEECFVSEIFIIHRLNYSNPFFVYENEDGYPVSELDEENLGYQPKEFKICK